jgi:hypothetical protein
MSDDKGNRKLKNKFTFFVGTFHSLERTLGISESTFNAPVQANGLLVCANEAYECAPGLKECIDGFTGRVLDISALTYKRIVGTFQSFVCELGASVRHPSTINQSPSTP